MTAQYIKPDRLKAGVDAALDRLRCDQQSPGRSSLVKRPRRAVRLLPF